MTAGGGGREAHRPGRATIIDGLVAVGLVAAAFLLYVRTLAPGLLWGDSAELQLAAWVAGFAHPTGYPLYLMLGWLWTHLIPWGDPAWRLNLFSAAAAALAVGLFYLVALRLLRAARAAAPDPAVADSLQAQGRRERLLALAGAAVAGCAPTFWSQAVVAEVYALHAALLLAVLYALLRWAEAADEPRGARAAVAVVLLYGLGLAHHRTMLLIAPAILAFVWLTLRRIPRAERRRLYGPRRLVLVACCLLAPLLLYLYIPLRAPHAPYAQAALSARQTLVLYEPSLRGFLAHVSGSAFAPALGGGQGLAASLGALAQRFLAELSWVGAALALGGLAWLLLARSSGGRRSAALTGLAFAGSVGFNLVYAIGDIHVFYIPAYLIWTLWMVVGAGALAMLLVRGAVRLWRGADPPRRLLDALSCGGPALLLALAAASAVGSFESIDRSADRSARVTWEGILAQPIPAGSLLLSNDRDEIAPQWHLKHAEGIRPDIIGLFPLLLTGPDWNDIGEVADQALRTGRRVYLIKPMPGMEVKFRLEPVPWADAAEVRPDETGRELGVLVRVAGPAVDKAPDRVTDIVYGGAIRLNGYDVAPAAARAGGLLEVVLYWQPDAGLAEAYTTFVHVVDVDGGVVGQSDRQPGGAYLPTSEWRAGEVYRDAHRISLSGDCGQPHALVVGLYVAEGGVLRHLGSPQTVGLLAD